MAYGYKPYENQDAQALLSEVADIAGRTIKKYVKSSRDNRALMHDRAVAAAQLLFDLGIWGVSRKETENFFRLVNQEDDNFIGWADPQLRSKVLEKLRLDVKKGFFG